MSDLITEELVGYMLSVRRVNTEEWMEGLAERLNRWAKKNDKPNRAATHGGGLHLITLQDMAETRPERC